MANPSGNRKVTRREFLRYAEIAGFAALAAPWLAACGAPAPAGPAAQEAAAQAVAAVAGIKDIPREKTFIAVRSGPERKFVEWDQWNPFVPVANHQYAVGVMYEPLAFYSAFADKEYLWLAESYEFNEDFTELIIKVRPNIKWSDGVDFTAEDVTFTLNTCKEAGSKIRWGANVAQSLEKAETIDPLTTKCTLSHSSPRFFWLLTYHFDIGVYMMPKHIFEGQDVSTFNHFDLEKGWPVTTSPWRVVFSSPEQKILDRADDWWGVAAGVAPLPEVERFILLPDLGEQQLVQQIITNEVDFTTGIQPSSWPTVIKGNPKALSWTGTESPWGYVDWWPKRAAWTWSSRIPTILIPVCLSDRYPFRIRASHGPPKPRRRSPTRRAAPSRASSQTAVPRPWRSACSRRHRCTRPTQSALRPVSSTSKRRS